MRVARRAAVQIGCTQGQHRGSSPPPPPPIPSELSQPLFVQDLAQAIFKVAISEDPEFMLGQTYDLAGACVCARAVE